MKSHVSLILVIIVTSARAVTFTVDSRSDSGAGSLRQAVLDAATSPGADTIVFNPAPFLPITRIGALGTSSGIDDDTLENHTVPAGTNRALAVVACHAAETDITSVSFGGLPLTQVIERTDGYVVVSFWTRAMGSSATPVTGNIVVTRAGTESLTQTTYAATYANVDQSLPMDSPVADPTNVAATTAVSVSSRPGDLMFNLIDGFRWSTDAATLIAGAGQTRLHESHGTGFEGGTESYATSVKPGNGDERMEWSGDFNVYFHIAANIRASAAINLSSEIPVNDTAGNTASDGILVSDQVTILANSIVFGNGNGDMVNESGELQRQGANTIGIFANAGSPVTGSDIGPPAIVANPLLSELGNYGGATRTIPLLPGSPARDASVGSTAIADQRGFPIVGNADLGAYEFGNLVQNYEAWALETLPSFLTVAQRSATFDLDDDGSIEGIADSVRRILCHNVEAAAESNTSMEATAKVRLTNRT